MDSVFVPPIAPMLARLERELPTDGYVYEPKWDGFRGLAFRTGMEIDLRSRNQRPLARYFPELVEALLALPAERYVLDGEIVAVSGDFPSLLARLHPAASRVERLRAETPALFIAFDVLAIESDDLRSLPFRERRRRLEGLLAEAAPPLVLTPLTADRVVGERWLESFEGVVAKHADLRYEAGARRMVKVKRERTADCVVAGFRWLVDRPLPSSLLLGLYDNAGDLRHVGIASSFAEAARSRLLAELRPHIVSLEGHPWERGFLLAGSPVGRLKGAAARWSADEMEQDWTPVAPRLVCEVRFDQVDDYRFRHSARFVRWRPDRHPRTCTLDQLATVRVALHDVLALS
jgi:ATP-dependent DNA ligase